MVHVPALIEDLALILAAAGVVTLVFRRFRQPVVLGYIVAGILVGPHFSLFPTIRDVENVRVWGEIGVIFLLFALGLEFNFKKLARVGGPASITAIVEVVGMASLGFFTGRFFGWSTMDSVFLGGILSISSTTIIIRAFEEVGAKGRGFVSLVFGVLIVEDLIAILLMVLLSTIAVSQSAVGGELVVAIVKLSFFLAFWFLAGIFILPTLLTRLRRHLSSETLLVIAIGLCFAMVILSTRAGFSPALGAFIMGSLLSETSEGHRIEHLISPVKDLFAAVFFVSVGMLIEPKVLVEYAGPIAILTVVTIVGKFLSTAMGVVLSGKGLRHAVQSGMSLAQIGEFSFIIAALGLSLKVTSGFLYPVAVGVSAITTFTTPYLIMSADGLYHWIDRNLPARTKQVLENYSQNIGRTSLPSDWSLLLRAYLTRMMINIVLIAAIFVGCKQLAVPFLISHWEDQSIANPAALMLALILSAPFFWAIVMGQGQGKLFQQITLEDKTRKIISIVFGISRWSFALFLFAILATQFIDLKSLLGITLAASIISLAIFSRRLESLYRSIEGQFVKNLTGTGNTPKVPALAPWDAHLESFEVHPQSELIGKFLEALKIRERFNVTIALIERGQKKIPAPGRNEMLFPGDRVHIIGNDEQIMAFRKLIEMDDLPLGDDPFNYTLQSYHVGESSPYVGRIIRDSGIREKSQGLVVGIERRGQRTLNPDSATKIEVDDLLWIVGESSALKNL